MMDMKRIYRLILFVIFAVALTTTVSAASGSCGANAVWEFDTERKLLTISGTGELSYELNCGPWYDYNADIKKVIIEDGITNINNNAFRDCKTLDEIVFPSTLAAIDYSAFYGCSSLKNVTIPDSVTTIEPGAFTCSGLESITLSSGMTLLDQATFSYCHALKTVVIPDSITMIKGFVFYQCDSLETIYYTGSETEWGKIFVDDYEDGNYPLYGDVDIVFEYKPESQTGAADSNANIDLSGKRYVQSSLQIFGYDYIPDEGFAFSDPTTSSPPYVEFTDSGSGIIYLWGSFADYFVDFTYTVDGDKITLYAAGGDTFGGTEKIVMKFDAVKEQFEIIDLNKDANHSVGMTGQEDIFSYDSSVTTTAAEDKAKAMSQNEAAKDINFGHISKDTKESVYPSSGSAIPEGSVLITGEIIGSETGWDGSENSGRASAFDGNIVTFFDPANAHVDWCGIDAGKEMILTKIVIHPRSGWAERFYGATIEASNDPEFENSVELFCNVNQATNAAYIDCTSGIDPSKNTGYRYFRYINYIEHGDVAEIKLYGYAKKYSNPIYSKTIVDVDNEATAKAGAEVQVKAETEQQSKDTAEDDTPIWSTVVTFENTPETEAEIISIPDDFDVAFETIKSMPAYKGIRTPEQLDAIRYDLSGHYILLNDIDMAEWGNWEPIGKGTLPFSGIFDGNGYCIQNLTLALDNSEDNDNPAPDDCGLFAAVYKAKIQNVYLENALYTVTSSDPTVGGIVGRASEYSCITNCHFHGTILCNSTYYPPEIGGIAGEADCVTTIEFCVSQGSIETSGYMNPSVGGIVGSCTGIEIDDHDANSEVCYCYSDCEITLLDTYNPARIGGIAGHVSIGAIQDCYYTGKITILYGSAYVGGIVGTLNGSINNCYSVGEIISETQQQTIGGIIGVRNRSFAENPIVNRCYILSGLYERGIGKDECGTEAAAIQSISDMEMKDPATYTDWDFDSVWLVDPAVNNGYPVLRQPVMEQMVIETQVDMGRIIFVSLIILGGGMIVFSLIQTILNLAKNKTEYRRGDIHDPWDTAYLKCRKCGHSNDSNAYFCGNCGTRLQD